MRIIFGLLALGFVAVAFYFARASLDDLAKAHAIMQAISDLIGLVLAGIATVVAAILIIGACIMTSLETTRRQSMHRLDKIHGAILAGNRNTFNVED